MSSSLCKPALLLVTASACAGSAVSSAPQPSPVSPPPERAQTPSAEPVKPYIPPAIDAAFAHSVRKAAELRGLQPLRPVQLRVVNRAELAAWMKMDSTPGAPDGLEEYERAVAVLLEQLPPSFDKNAAIELWSMTDAAAGTFNAVEDQMLVRDDLDPGTEKTMLVHEAVHGLQNQHFDIAKRRAWRPDDGDRRAAFDILVEADATSAASYLDDHALPMDARSLRSKWSCEHAGIPRAAAVLSCARYVHGLPFVHRARASGGWEAVNQLWARPPKSTEQVLHPDKYDADEPPEVVSVPPGPGSDWERVYTDVMGELVLRVGLEEWVSMDDAERVSTGWAGDRLALYSRRATKEWAVAWRLRFDEPPSGSKNAEAAEARDALLEVLRRVAIGGKVQTSRRGDVQAWCAERLGLGPMSFAVRGRDIVLVAGPATLQGKSARSSDTCELGLRWSAAAAMQERP